MTILQAENLCGSDNLRSGTTVNPAPESVISAKICGKGLNIQHRHIIITLRTYINFSFAA